LHDLDPVSAGILWRQNSEFRAGCRADAGDDGLQGDIGIGVDDDIGMLTDREIRKLHFLQIGLDPRRAVGDKREQGIARLDIFPRLQGDAPHPTRARRDNLRIVEVQSGAVALRNGESIFRVAFNRRIRAARQIGPDLFPRLVGGMQGLARGDQFVFHVIQRRL
jgi:hypothetical protein